MADLKREYVVPLRRKTRTAPRWRRSKKAVSVLKDFMRQHMKAENVIVCNELNQKIWENGAKNPPGKVSVIALRTTVNDQEATLVNLLEAGVDKQVELYKKDLKAPVIEKPEDAKEEAQDAEAKEVKSDDKKDDKKEAPAKEDKKEAKEAPKKESKKEEAKK